MFTNFRNSAVLTVLIVLVNVAAAAAQARVGTRAQGMAGAFVAVADDATAVYWNPAGIATGAFVSAVADFGAERDQKSAFVGVSATAFGLAYYRAEAYGTRVSATAVTSVPGREEVGHSVHALTTSVAGVSVVQSLSEHVVVGATPKLMRAVMMDASSTRGDVDAGAMFYASRVRVGVVAHNLTAPEFNGLALKREVRAGAAVGSGWTGASRVIVSADADLNSRPAPDGERRDIAGGVETWWLNQRLAVRGGVSRSTIGEGRAAVAAGMSAGLKPGVLLEAHVTRGDRMQRSWSVGARMSF